MRGFLARRRLRQQHAAATTIQCAVRAFQNRKRAAAVEALKQQMAEMARLMQQYSARTAAALHIQVGQQSGVAWQIGSKATSNHLGMCACTLGVMVFLLIMPVSLPFLARLSQAAYRGHQGRKEYRRLLAEQQERLRQQEEREAAALAVIAPWAKAFRDRTWFLRARRAAPVLQAWWRREFAHRQAAAVTIQAAVRCFLAQQQMQRSRQAALVVQVGLCSMGVFWPVHSAYYRRKCRYLMIASLAHVLTGPACSALQTAWRGSHVRVTHPHRKQLADIRLRLSAAAVNAGLSASLLCLRHKFELPCNSCQAKFVFRLALLPS